MARVTYGLTQAVNNAHASVMCKNFETEVGFLDAVREKAEKRIEQISIRQRARHSRPGRSQGRGRAKVRERRRGGRDGPVHHQPRGTGRDGAVHQQKAGTRGPVGPGVNHQRGGANAAPLFSGVTTMTIHEFIKKYGTDSFELIVRQAVTSAGIHGKPNTNTAKILEEALADLHEALIFESITEAGPGAR
jgi:hypothetical protein